MNVKALNSLPYSRYFSLKYKPKPIIMVKIPAKNEKCLILLSNSYVSLYFSLVFSSKFISSVFF